MESSDDRNPVIARFPLIEGVDAEPLIEKATSLIADLKAGRITQKQAMLTHYACLTKKPREVSTTPGLCFRANCATSS